MAITWETKIAKSNWNCVHCDEFYHAGHNQYWTDSGAVPPGPYCNECRDILNEEIFYPLTEDQKSLRDYHMDPNHF